MAISEMFEKKIQEFSRSISLVFYEFFTNFPGGLCGRYAHFRQLDATFTVYILMTACYHIVLNIICMNIV